MKREWDEFIMRSKNATFLHLRDYLDYHSDRFTDCSLIFCKGRSIRAVMPACLIEDSLVSHAGLTYGGFLMSTRTSAEETLRFFTILKTHLHELGITKLIIKPAPHIYHSLPAEEDLYAIFRLGGYMSARNISSVIPNENRISFRKDRNAGFRKALQSEIAIITSSDYKSFWRILTDNLNARYGASPVHSLQEITMLADRFPHNIRLHLAISSEGTPIGGTVIYLTSNVAHTQYISATEHGKKAGVIDMLFHTLINDTYRNVRYFDFGTSNENNGAVLNESLICQKEGFGGRAVCYDTYTIPIP